MYMFVEYPSDILSSLGVGHQAPWSAIWRSPNLKGMSEPPCHFVFRDTSWIDVRAMETDMFRLGDRIRFLVSAFGEVGLRHHLMQLCQQVFV